jgi:pyrroloquinoline quinone biosynthesis protein B
VGQKSKRIQYLAALCLILSACQENANDPAQNTTPLTAPDCSIALTVLGTAQDAGKPQISVHQDPAWTDPSKAKMASSLGLIHKGAQTRYLFDATPDIKQQLYNLDQWDDGRGFALDGVFLTHGHMGHYLGLAHLGREAMGAKSIPVYAMPKMENFLRENGPWDQLVALKNIELQTLSDGEAVSLATDLTVTPFQVPHRSEYTETVGYRVTGPSASAIYLPDIDSWTAWEAQDGSLENLVLANDRLYLDATFFSGAELPGRDMSLIPHPTISTTMEKLAHMLPQERAKIYFIHLNHSNPAHDKNSDAYKALKDAGFNVAEEGDRFCLSE